MSFVWYLTNKFVCRYEFEQTKKNNLLFYGIANDPRETAFQVAKSDKKILLNLRVKAEMENVMFQLMSKISSIIRTNLDIRRDIPLSKVVHIEESD